MNIILNCSNVRNGILSISLACVIFAVLCACSEGLITESYRLEAPEIPEIWLSELGRPLWLFEWIDASGNIVRAESGTSSYSGAQVLHQYPSPVLAYPSWPLRGIRAGVMKPAGAIFPYDAAGKTIVLSFAQGIDAVLYHELAILANEKRLPYNFDWLRFRALWANGKISGEALHDPWLVDWRAFAENTAASGFNARRIKARETENLVITVPADGPWFGTSPFMAQAAWTAGTTVVLQVSEVVDSYFCSSGTLRATRNVFTWLPSR
ncbi:MAG: hypothetical protein LBD22_02485 [Spirochaetaceae bacterium]|nr:hypothetical protein [Spirochaetaceae bacterium]